MAHPRLQNPSWQEVVSALTTSGACQVVGEDGVAETVSLQASHSACVYEGCPNKGAHVYTERGEAKERPLTFTEDPYCAGWGIWTVSIVIAKA